MRIYLPQLYGDAVVFAKENGLKNNQQCLLIDAGITGLETKEIATEPFASDVRFIQFRRQEILKAQFPQNWVGLEQTAAVGPQTAGRLLGCSVNETGVQVAGHRIKSASRSWVNELIHSVGAAKESDMWNRVPNLHWSFSPVAERTNSKQRRPNRE